MSSTNLRILQISKKIPYPQRDGESMANAALARLLSESDVAITVDLLSLHTNKHRTGEAEARKALSMYTQLDFIDHHLRQYPLQLLTSIIRNEAYAVRRFHSTSLSESLRKKIRENQYDIILMETIYMGSYLEVIRQYSPHSVIVLRMHNIEHQLWEQRAQAATSVLRKWIYRIIAKQLSSYIDKLVGDVDAILAIGTKDYTWLQSKYPDAKTHYLPVTVYSDDQKYATSGSGLNIGFIGSMDWEPNVHGLEWFMTEVWEKLVELTLPIQLHLAGRHYPVGMLADIPGVNELGELVDVGTFYDKIDVVVVPLFVGSGVRIKIIEAMSRAKAVISTTVGMSGIDIQSGRDALIVNTGDEFIETIKNLAGNNRLISQLQENAHVFYLKYHDPRQICDQLLKLLNDLRIRKPN